MLHKNDEDILNTIYKNSRMAYDSTRQVIGECPNEELNEYLRRQTKHYADIALDIFIIPHNSHFVNMINTALKILHIRQK